MTTFRQRLGPLEERPFRLLWLARTTSSLGDGLVPVALAFAVLEELDGSASELGVVFAAFSFSRVALTLAGGVWADRLPRRLVMLVSDAVRAVVEFVVFALFLTGSMNVWTFAALAALLGAATAFFGPASTGLVAETVSRPRLQQANALMGISGGASWIVGPAVSGLLVAGVGPAWVFAIDGASYVASAAFLLAIRVAPRIPTPPQRFVRDLAAGWREVAARSWLWVGLITFALSNMSSAAFWVLGPIVFEEEAGGAADWGAAMTMGAVGGLLGSLTALRWRPRRPLVAAFLVWTATGLPLAALAGPASAAAVGAAAAVSFASISLGNAIWEATLQEQVPNDVLSRVSSYDWLVSLLFQPLGFMLAGPLAAAVGRDTMLWSGAALSVSANLLVLALPSARGVRRAGPDATPEGPSTVAAADETPLATGPAPPP